MTDYDSYKYSEEEALLRGTRWANEDEIKAATRVIRLSDPAGKISSGLPVISDGNTVYLDDSDAHSLIIGSTGSKKTRLFAMPMLEIMRRANESVLVTDPKGELYELTAQAFENSGYKVNVINLRDPVHSNSWNPFAMARAYLRSGEGERAAGIVNDFAASVIHDKPFSHQDPFWTQTARAMLQGLLMTMVEGIPYFPDDTVNLVTLRHLSDEFNQPNDYGVNTGVMKLLESYPSTSLASTNLRAVLRGSEKTFDNIRVSYDAPMQQLYIQKALINMLSRHEVDLQALGRQKTILYLIMPDEKTTLHFIVSLIIKQCYEQLIDLAQRSPGKTLPIRVNFLLDEFSNLPMVPDMPAMISAARSRNIRFYLIIQGLYQLSSKYGPDDAQTIKGNCGNWVFLTSRELPLLNEISELCGEDALTGEKLITVSQLQRLNKDRGEALILLGRQYPYIAHLADISEYRLTHAGVRPYPNAPKTRVPAQTIGKIFSMQQTVAHAMESKQDDMEEDEENYLDIQKELERRFDELFGNTDQKKSDGE